MKAVVQRVARAQVTVAGEVTGRIGPGLLVLLGVGKHDTETEAAYLAGKIVGLRIFEDSAGKMNASVADIGGGVLVVSQFTLFGETRHGRRPSFDAAARPEQAKLLYECFLLKVRNHGLQVQAGVFQAHMEVELLNDGPVTLLCESPVEWRQPKIP